MEQLVFFSSIFIEIYWSLSEGIISHVVELWRI